MTIKGRLCDSDGKGDLALVSNKRRALKTREGVQLQLQAFLTSPLGEVSGH